MLLSQDSQDTNSISASLLWILFMIRFVEMKTYLICVYTEYYTYFSVSKRPKSAQNLSWYVFYKVYDSNKIVEDLTKIMETERKQRMEQRRLVKCLNVKEQIRLVGKPPSICCQ